MTLAQLLKAKRKEILRIAKKHGASNVRVFGSVAKNNCGPESDIDLLVDLEPGRSLFDHAALLLDLEDALHCKVDVVTSNGLKARIRKQVLEEAVLL